MSQKEKRIRCQNFSAREEGILLSLVEKYKNVVESKKTDAVSWKEKNETWENVHNDFCAQTDTFRTAKMLRDKCDNMKKKTKVLMAAQKREIYLTGGGPVKKFNSSTTTDRLAALMGEGAMGLANAYDGDHIQEYIIENSFEISPTNETSCANETSPVKEVDNIVNAIIIITDENDNKNWSSCKPADLKSKKSPQLSITTTSKKRKTCFTIG